MYYGEAIGLESENEVMYALDRFGYKWDCVFLYEERSTARCINPKILIWSKFRADSQPWNRKFDDGDLHLELPCVTIYAHNGMSIMFLCEVADVFRTIRLVIPKRVRSRHASQRTHTKRSVANGLSAIYINAARNSTTKIKRGRRQAVRSIRNCKKYSPWSLMRRRNDFDYDYGGKSIFCKQSELALSFLGITEGLGQR